MRNVTAIASATCRSPARRRSPAALGDQPLDPAATLGRDPVAVDVPPRPGVAQEALLLGVAQRLPQAPGCAAGGCPPRRASRPGAARRAASATVLQRSLAALRRASTGAGHGRHGRAAIRPRRDKATIRPRCRPRRGDSTTSTMVRPVPISSTSPPLAARSTIAARPVAPRIVDEQLGRQAARQRRRRGGWLPTPAPAPGPRSATHRPA